ncbi:hypothetical protein BJ994_001249 [Arthrobacter pigmenti]|uniref:Uncharacterized protein n=1 Tax=Arthrobacter pigmenti TaxID=271432 RepID=A0A846RGC1_9MICC|nr:hypothetical protein [Arthrobacter pigmenti]NJC22173.1 hypothetical protein [Arthrobacter pigmenti]
MTEYGQYFGALGATLDAKASWFLDEVDVSQFGELGDDVHSEPYYQQVFNGEATPGINAMIAVFQAS